MITAEIEATYAEQPAWHGLETPQGVTNEEIIKAVQPVEWFVAPAVV